MSGITTEELPAELDPECWPNLDEIIFPEKAPHPSIGVEKQQRLLTEPLYSCWELPEGEGGFLALANVGLFPRPKDRPFVPDFIVTRDVELDANLWAKENRSYFVWIFGRPPDLVGEIVSDRTGGEEGHKMAGYALMRAPFYVIYDPNRRLNPEPLRAFALERTKYVPTDPRWFAELGLGLTLWDGVYENARATWLRWCDKDGIVIPTGKEMADFQRRRAEEERRRADKAEEEKQRLLAQLKALGIEPNL
jgi:hypothetical protein